MWNYLQDNIMDRFLSHEKVKSKIRDFERKVESEQIHPAYAADELLRIFTEQQK